MELPVTSVIEAELDEEELAWDDTAVCISKAAMVELSMDKETSSSSLSSCELEDTAMSHTGALIVTSLLDEMLLSVVATPPIALLPRGSPFGDPGPHGDLF